MKKNNYAVVLLFLALLCTVLPAAAHWTTKGPYTGGAVKCFTVADTVLYVGSENGGVYWSKNKSVLSWTYVNYTGLASSNISALTSIGTIVSPEGMKVIAGTSDAGVFVSRDKGITWTASNSGLLNTNITALIHVGQYIFAGTNAGIYVSQDSAKTWTTANTGLSNTGVTSFANNGSVLYAGTEGGVFTSTNNGASWTISNTGLTTLNVKTLIVSGTTLFAGTANGVYTSSTSVISWSTSNSGLSNTVINGFSESGGVVYAATNAGVFSSPEASVSWTAANLGYEDTVSAVVVFNNKLYAGSPDDGILRSSSLSSVSWSMFNTGFNNLQAHTVYNSGNLVLLATNKGFYVSRDLAANYVASNTGLTDSLHVSSITFAGTKLYAATELGGVFVSADTGRTWTTSNTGLSVLNIKKIIATYTHLYAATANGKVFVSPLTAIVWAASTGLPAGLEITSIATDGSDVFMGTNGAGVYICSDASTWNSFNHGLSNLNVTSMAVRGTTIFAGTRGAGVFRYTIFNPQWTQVNNGLTNLTITSLAASGQWITAGCKGAVYGSSSDGYEWKPTNVELYLPSYAEIHTISFTPSSTRLFAATLTNTIYSNGVGELAATAVEPTPVTSISEAEQAISSIQLSPNPNKGQFSIIFNTTNDVALKEILIYNSVGAVMDRFETIEETIEVNYPKGMYYVLVNTSIGSVTRKMLLE